MAQRLDGYAPIRDYGALGDGRTVALVARDGAVEWLPLPDLDSPTVFAAILDDERGGRFALGPELPFTVSRRYLAGTNVLETTFVTDGGAVRVTDALTLPDNGLTPLRELQRRIDGLSGRVSMRWRLEPRFGYAGWPFRLASRSGIPVATAGSDALALQSFAAGEPVITDRSIEGRFEAAEGSSALLAVSFAHQEPLVFPTRGELAARLDATCVSWRCWADDLVYEGPWRESVIRSALALKLLVYAPSGAIAAAATAALPEELGGERNWDYRYSWIRDSAFAIDALLQLGCSDEAHAYFWWLMHATQLTHPRLHLLYRLDGGTRVREHELPLAGYRQSRPVRSTVTSAAGSPASPTWSAPPGGNPTPASGKSAASPHISRSRRCCARSRSTAHSNSPSEERSPTTTRTAGAQRQRRSAISSRRAAGRTTSTATSAPPATTSSTPASCSPSCTATATRTTNGCERRSPRSNVSSLTVPTFAAIGATTGFQAAKEHSSPAPSGSPKHSLEQEEPTPQAR